jgi:hypothetical protein
MQSSHEYEKIPYIVEAIDFCKSEIVKIQNPTNQSQHDQNGNDEPVDFEEKKRIHNKK